MRCVSPAWERFLEMRLFWAESQHQPGPLNLRLRSRQFARHHHICKSAGLVRTVTERLVCRMPATAKADRSAPGQTVAAALGVHDLEVAFDTDRSIVIHGYLGCRHSRSRKFGCRYPTSMPGD